MNTLVNRILKNKFYKKFKTTELNKNFYEITTFRDDEVGVVLKRKNKDREEISLIRIAVLDQKAKRLPLYLEATFGVLSKDGSAIRIRNEEQIDATDPIDITSDDDYTYDLDEDQIYKGRKKITVDMLVNNFYMKHIKPTKPLLGFGIRFKIYFWRKFLKTIVETVLLIPYWSLFFITGIKFRYNAFFNEEEEVNSILPNSEPQLTTAGHPKMISFFNYQVPLRTLIFYCTVHLFFYGLFLSLKIRPYPVVTVLNNNFLTLIYVILSLSILEKPVPFVLRKLIKFLSKLSFHLSMRAIKV